MKNFALVLVLVLTLALPGIHNCVGGEPARFQCNNEEERAFLGKLLHLSANVELSMDEAFLHFDVEWEQLAETTGNGRTRGFSWRLGNGTIATLLFHQDTLILYHASMFRIRDSQEIARSSNSEKFMLHPMYWERGSGLNFSLRQHFNDLPDTERILDTAAKRAEQAESLKP